MNETGHRLPPAAILAVPLVAAIVLTLFAWPSARLEPRDLPIGVAGSGPAAAAIEQRLGEQSGAFEVHRYADEADARAAIEDRDIYGSFVAAPAGLEVLIASGASQAVAQLEVIEGDWLANAGALGLTVLAIAATVTAGYALLRERGIVIAALLMVLVGSPFSGVGSAPELLPEPVGAIGQLMPPGAGGNLVRSTGYFDGAGGGEHVIVLVVWTLAGFALLGLAAARARPTSRSDGRGSTSSA